MRNKPKNDEELLIRVNEVLHYLWDPIGVAGEPRARDEYDSYAVSLLALLKTKPSVENIEKYLNTIVIKDMGLQLPKQNNGTTAEVLLDWMDYYEEEN